MWHLCVHFCFPNHQWNKKNAVLSYLNSPERMVENKKIEWKIGWHAPTPPVRRELKYVACAKVSNHQAFVGSVPEGLTPQAWEDLEQREACALPKQLEGKGKIYPCAEVNNYHVLVRSTLCFSTATKSIEIIAGHFTVKEKRESNYRIWALCITMTSIRTINVVCRDSKLVLGWILYIYSRELVTICILKLCHDIVVSLIVSASVFPLAFSGI